MKFPISMKTMAI